MNASPRGYWVELIERFGQGWNRFWFVPAQAHTVCLLRMLVGALAFYLIASFGPDLDLFFAEGGLLPVDDVKAIRESGGRSVRWSYLDYVATPSQLMAVHIAGLAILGCMTIGLASRVTTVLSLVVFLSYFHRGPMLTSEVDLVVAFLLLYLCVGPTGDHASLDRWLATRTKGQAIRPAPSTPAMSANLCVRLIQVHVSGVYLLMALGKLSYSDVWWDGTAVWWLLARPESTPVDFHRLGDWAYFVNGWTHAIVAFELSFAVLIWVPLARPLFLALGAVAWTSLALLTGMLPFCTAMFVASLAFLSPKAAANFLGRLKRPDAS